MTTFGYKLMTEEHGPHALVEQASNAEKSGFDFLAISDHFHPWIEKEGHACFVWTVLGAIAGATESARLMTAVTCPILRYHPAIVAQAAATMAILSNGRFSLGLGSGEQLNEHVVGRGWPCADVRHEMLVEAVEAMRELWKGGMQSYRGLHVTVEDAKIYDLPDEPPAVVIAVGGNRAARLAAEHGDGMITTVPSSDWIGKYREAGGEGPLYVEAGLCWGPSEDEAAETAHTYGRWSALGSFKVLAELPNVANFEDASERISPDDMKQSLPCGPDVDRHVEAIREYIDAGFDHVCLHQVGPDQEGFLRFWREELGPRLRDLR